MKRCLIIANTILGKRGNIGFRLEKVVKGLAERKVNVIVVARGCQKSYGANSKVYSMGLFGHFSRILNGIRIYLSLNFKSRLYDIWIFQLYFSLWFFFMKRSISAGDVALISESSPFIIKKLKDLGLEVVLDVPICPSSYSESIIKKIGNGKGFSSVAYLCEYEQLSVGMADRIVVPSAFVFDEMIKMGAPEHKLNLVQFGSDCPKAARLKKIEYKTSYVFCFAGVINFRKGVNYLLEAWNCDEFKLDELHLCGRVTPEVKSIVKEMGLKNVQFPGFVDVNNYFSHCDFYVFPSLMEGSSKSIFEAMSQALPVITTYESGSPINDGIDGFLVPAMDSGLLRLRMLEFKRNPKLAFEMGRKGFEKVSFLSWDRYVQSTISVLGL